MPPLVPQARLILSAPLQPHGNFHVIQSNRCFGVLFFLPPAPLEKIIYSLLHAVGGVQWGKGFTGELWCPVIRTFVSYILKDIVDIVDIVDLYLERLSVGLDRLVEFYNERTSIYV